MTLTHGVPVRGELRTRLCESLSLAESDDIFFPSIPGKKPTRARALCAQCPFESACLMEALKYDLKGFWAGTTEPERKAMVKLNNIIQQKLEDVMPVVEQPTAARSRYLHIVKTPDNHSWLDEVEPSPQELEQLSQAV